MNRLLSVLALACALPLAAIPQCAAAIEDSDREDPFYYYSALLQMQDAVFALDVETQRDEAVRTFLEIATEARAAQTKFASQPEEVARFTDLEGTALYYAAEYNLFDSANTEARAREVSWLIDSVAAFERIITDNPATDFPFYEYGGSTTLLFQHGAWLGDPRLTEWSRSKVRAARATLADYAATSDDPETLTFQKNGLAQALLESGFISKDQASIDEANAILDSLGEENVDYYSSSMRDAVAKGVAPFAAPGEDY